jgi:hypothetical protein
MTAGHGEETVRILGWSGFLLWALVGALYGLTYLAMMSIGIVILPLAVIATVAAARRLRVWPELLGIALAPAVVMMRLASLNWGIPRCGPGEQPHMEVSGSGSGSVTTGAYTETMRIDGCVDINVPFLLYGAIALLIAALVAYIAARYRLAQSETQ